MNTRSILNIVGGSNSVSDFLLMACIWMFSLSMQAQTPTGKMTVKGILQDSVTHETIPYATIRITADQSNKPIAMGVSGDDGRFSLSVAANGPLTAWFSSVGKTVVKKTFTPNGTSTTCDLGTVLMHDAPKALKGVEVVALKPLVTAAPDKLTYDVASDPETPTKNALEMLRKVPLVAVDGQDNITVKGSGNFKVYVNGKPNPMMTNNAKEILKTLPASQIAKVEVITDLGAKYDAEGTAGVINIVMVGNEATAGYTATITGMGGNTMQGGGVNATVQSGKLTLNANYNYYHIHQPVMYIDGLREDFTSNANRFLQNKGTQQTPSANTHMGGLDASYELSKHNLLSVGVQLFGSNMHLMQNSGMEMSDVNRNRQYAYRMFSNQSLSNFNVNTHVDFQHAFNDKGSMFTLSYNLYTQPQTTRYTTRYEAESGTSPMLNDYMQKNTTHFTEHTVQADYVNPFSAHHYMDAGLKYIYRRNASDAHSAFLNEQTTGVDDNNSGKYLNQYHIFAAYSDYRYTIGAFTARGGLRYEFSKMSIKYAQLANGNFAQNYNDLVPGLTLTYVPAPTQMLKLAYNMRIQRPSIGMLNPFVDRSSPFTISYGNAQLNTEKYHSVELSYGSFGSKLKYNAAVGYEVVNNGLESYTVIRDGVAETTYGNVVKTNNLNMNLWLSYNPWQLTRLMLSANTGYKDMQSRVLQRKLHGWEYTIYGSVQQQLPANFTASLWGAAAKQQFKFNEQQSVVWVYGATLTAEFLKEKRLTVALNATNPFATRTNVDVISHTPQFHLDQHVRFPIRSLMLTVSYRIGSLKAQVRKAQRSIENNDLKSAEKKQPGAEL